MDCVTWINTGVGIISIIVGIIGVVVGIIGAKNISYAKKIVNKYKINADNGATVYNAETINQGISENTVRLITKDMTKEEMCKLIVRLVPISTDNTNCVAHQLRQGAITSDRFEELLEKLPTTYYGKNPPPGFPNTKDGDIWYHT